MTPDSRPERQLSRYEGVTTRRCRGGSHSDRYCDPDNRLPERTPLTDEERAYLAQLGTVGGVVRPDITLSGRLKAKVLLERKSKDQVANLSLDQFRLDAMPQSLQICRLYSRPIGRLYQSLSERADLVEMDVERDIAKLNPPEQGQRTDLATSYPEGNKSLSSKIKSDIR